MAKWDAGTITTNGVDVPVQVDDYDGKWSAQYAGKNLSHETRDKLVAALGRLTKQAKVEVAVPVIRITEYQGWDIGNIKVARGYLTGIHSGNGNVLATWAVRGTEMKEQITRDNGVSYVGGDTTDSDLDEYNRLLRIKADTLKKIHAWNKAHGVDVRKAVEVALDAKAGSGDE